LTMREAIAQLNALGIETAMPTGDNRLCWPCAPFYPVIDPPCSGEKFGGRWLLGRPSDLAAKAKGDNSMVGKRERPEDA